MLKDYEDLILGDTFPYRLDSHRYLEGIKKYSNNLHLANHFMYSSTNLKVI